MILRKFELLPFKQRLCCQYIFLRVSFHVQIHRLERDTHQCWLNCLTSEKGLAEQKKASLTYFGGTQEALQVTINHVQCRFNLL